MEKARPAKNPMGELSAQERRVLALISEGKTNKEIASVLGLGEKTVRNYVSNLMEKLQISRRSEAAAWYVRCTTQLRTDFPNIGSSNPA
jgi:two-component system response regulator DevR